MSRKNSRSWTPETSALAHAAKARKRMEGPPPAYPPPVEVGRVLHTIRVESHRTGIGFEVLVRQAPRRNQVTVETFGRRSKPHGLDWLARKLRARLLQR